MPDSQPPEDSRGDVEGLFAEHIAGLAEGVALDDAALCGAYPEHAEALHALCDQWRLSRAALDDAGRSVQVTSRGADDSAWHAFIEQLQSRGPAHTRYVFRGEIARGGMGVIQRVYDQDVRRPLAMKVILGKDDSAPGGGTPQVDDRTLGRFLEEAQVTGQLDHPGIVPVHEVGVDIDGQVYFTMKLVKGEDLRSVFDRVHDDADDSWNQTRALGVIQRVCEAMAYAHDKQVIHRDLKPGNVMVGKFGEVYVMDWGLARVLGQVDKKDIRIVPKTASESELRNERRELSDTPDDALLTMDGDIVGTPAYMPPEQAEGRIEDVGPAADIYALGAMLYHLLAGHMPYVRIGARKSSRMILAEVSQGSPLAISVEAPDAAGELVAICEKAMSREVGGRYKTMNELAGDLRAFLEDRVVSAYESGSWAELKKWVVRNKALAMTAAMALVSVLALSGWAVFERYSARRERNTAQSERDAAVRNLYFANVSAAAAALAAGEADVASAFLDGCPSAQRGWEWGHMRLRANPQVAEVALPEDTSGNVQLDPFGRVVAITTANGIQIVDATTGQEIRRMARGYEPTALCFDDSGRWILAGGPDGLVSEWDVITGDPGRSFAALVDTVVCVDWSDDRSVVIASDAAGSVALWRGEQSRPVLEGEAIDGGFGASAVAIRRDGQIAAVAQLDRTVHLLDTSAGATVHVVRGFRGTAGSLRFLADGVNLLSAGGGYSRLAPSAVRTSEATLISTSVGRIESRLRTDGLSFFESALAVSWPIALSGGIKTSVGIFDLDQNALIGSIPNPGRKCSTVSLDAMGTTAATTHEDRSLRLWSIDMARSHSLWPVHSDQIMRIGYSPDSTIIYSVSQDRQLAITDARSGLLLARASVSGPPCYLSDLAVSPIGPAVAIASGDLYRRIRSSTTQLTSNIYEGGPSYMPSVDAEPVRFFDDRGLSMRTSLIREDACAISVAFSPDGATLAAGMVFVEHDEHGNWRQRGVVEIVDAMSREIRAHYELDGYPIVSIGFVPSGHELIAADTQGGVFRIDLVTSEVSGEWHVADSPSVVPSDLGVAAVSPQGDCVAAASVEGTVVLWSLEADRRLGDFVGHREVVRGIAFHPDGRRIATASEDGTVRIWDRLTLRCLLTLGGDAEGMNAVCFSPDGMSLAAGGHNGALRMWLADEGVARERWQATTAFRRAERRLEAALARVGFVDDASRSILADPMIPSEERSLIAAIADTSRPRNTMEDAIEICRVVLSGGMGRSVYQRALQQIVATGEEKQGLYTILRLVAQFRVGEYRMALDAIEAHSALGGDPSRYSPGSREVLLFVSAGCHLALGDVGAAGIAHAEGSRLLREMVLPSVSDENIGGEPLRLLERFLREMERDLSWKLILEGRNGSRK